MRHRLMLSVVMVGQTVWGYLVVMEHGGRLDAHDAIVAQRTSTVIALELAAQRRATEAEPHALETLTRDLITGADDPSSLSRRAAYYGIVLTEPHVVCLLSSHVPERGSPLASYRVAQALARLAPARRLLLSGAESGTVIVLPLDPTASRTTAIRNAAAFAAELIDLLAPGVADAALSTACTTPEHFAGAYQEALQVSRCIGTFRSPAAGTVLTADDLGAARLLLSKIDRAEADLYVRTTLGALLADRRAASDVLTRLEAFFDCSRSIRRAADHLNVHENTVRYRLARVHELTGRDVTGTSDDQLAVQVALMILRLEGRTSQGPASQPVDARVAGSSSA
jgi:DNA-binding PucR family transcriptional regulator